MIEIFNGSRNVTPEPHLQKGILTNLDIGTLDNWNGTTIDDNVVKTFNAGNVLRIFPTDNDSITKELIGAVPLDIDLTATSNNMSTVQQRVILYIYLKNNYKVHLNYLYQNGNRPAFTLGTSADPYVNPILYNYGYVPTVNTSYKYGFRFKDNKVDLLLNDTVVSQVTLNNRSPISRIDIGGLVTTGNGFRGTISDISVVKK